MVTDSLTQGQPLLAAEGGHALVQVRWQPSAEPRCAVQGLLRIPTGWRPAAGAGLDSGAVTECRDKDGQGPMRTRRVLQRALRGSVAASQAPGSGPAQRRALASLYVLLA